MKKYIQLILITIMAMFILTACGSTSSNNHASTSNAPKGSKENPFVLGVSPMAGWYAWYGVDGTGIFEKNGVYVDIQFFSVYSDSLTAFYSGKVDGICIAASDTISPLNEGVDFQVVLVNDNSAGADALVVQDGIKSITDLKGKTVATEVGTLEHMFLLKMLADNGMTIDDINFTNMTINDAGPAFIAGSVDAAVLWEPTLSTTLKSKGTVLYSTESEPGLIPDTLAVNSSIIKNNPDVVQAVVNSWFDGVEKLNAKDDAFIQAICDGAELSKDDYLQILKGVTIFDKKKNQATFKEGRDFTSLKYCLDQSADFLLSTNMIDKKPGDTSTILNDTFIQ